MKTDADYIIEALVESGRDNIIACMNNAQQCLDWLNNNPDGTPEDYDSFRVNELGMMPALRTIKRKGLSEVVRITKEDLSYQRTALTLVA